MLRVTLLGNLGADPEVRYTSKGTQFVSFRVAVSQVRTGPDGERQENTEWFRVRVSGRQSEYAQRLGKGGRALVIGRLDISKYQGKDGETRTGFDVWADDIQIISPGRAFGPDAEAAEVDGEAEPALAGARANGANGANGRARPAREASSPGSEDMEDLPF